MALIRREGGHFSGHRRLRMSVEGIANGARCYCSMEYIKPLKLCRIVRLSQVSFALISPRPVAWSSIRWRKVSISVDWLLTSTDFGERVLAAPLSRELSRLPYALSSIAGQAPSPPYFFYVLQVIVLSSLSSFFFIFFVFFPHRQQLTLMA